MIEKQCDLVVLGGGGSGLTAAVRAAQEGGLRVTVAEKAPKTGGGMIMASTMRTFRSRWQAERSLPDVTNDYLRKVMDATYWRLDPALVSNAVLATGKFFDWFCDLAGSDVGKRFRVGRYVFDGEDGPLGPQMGGPGGVTGGGRLFMDTLRDKCGELGVEILTGHRALDAEVENGRIRAIIAEGPDGPVRIGCRACILAIGSWINNRAIMEDFCPAFLQAREHMGLSPHMNPNYTGDGFPIAEKVNAMIDRENFCIRVMGPMVMSKSGVMSRLPNTPYTLAVNAGGKRYICEPSHIRFGVFNSGLVMLEQTRGVSYVLFDTNNLEAALHAQWNDPQPDAPGIFGLPDWPQTMEDALRDIESALTDEPDKVFRADSIEALAAQLGIEPDALRATIDQYNEGCAEGFDRVCFKQTEYLVPFSKGPYYAVRAELGTDGCFGGVKVNGDMQAYRADGTLIDGLYVTGDFASGRFLNMTNVKVQVLNDMSWALASGFLAGQNARRALLGGSL